MLTKVKNTGGPVYPQAADTPVGGEGITLRDHFAAVALQGILTNNKEMRRLAEIEQEDGGTMYEGIAYAAYNLADEMIRVRREARDTAVV
ncbi:hypothetical protein EBZ39_04555 [bacterium]|nr:hypothetical protein [bacterium]